MISIRALALLGLFAPTAFAGSCTNGQDQIGVSQTCGGRCHVYNVGDYGACGDQVTSAMLSKDCGTSPQNACISTFNAGWDSSKSNCGNCYYVQMKYSDGSVNSVYLKTIDTNGSETKFEMMQYAWQKLCPYLCQGAGNCANKKSLCPGSQVFEETLSYPISCAAQSGEVTFERVDCNGSGSSSSGSSSSGSSSSSKDKESSSSSKDKESSSSSKDKESSSSSSSSSKDKGSSSSSSSSSKNKGSSSSSSSSSKDKGSSSSGSSSSSSSSNKSSSSSSSSKKKSKSKSDSSDSSSVDNNTDYSNTDDSDTDSSNAAEAEELATPVERCREAMGGISLRTECQARCTHYAEHPIICGTEELTGSALIACVARLNPSCA